MSQSIPKTMKALRLTKFKENYHLQSDVAVPTPGPKEILVRLVASGFCHTDHMVYEGAFKTKLPHIGSHEPTGKIAALGSDVAGDWKIGDQVGVYLFKNACGHCSGCKWHVKTYDGKLNARYCFNQAMNGIVGADGGFSEYMVTSDDAIVRIPNAVPFDQSAPLMCAGATVYNGLLEANLEKGQSVAIVGIGALGLLGIQFAKAMGYKVLAVSSRDLTPQLEGVVPKSLWPDLTLSSKDEHSAQRILNFTEGVGLDAAVVCTDNLDDNDWILHRLRPRGTSVVLGLPGEPFRFDAINMTFHEITVKGALHASVESMERMFEIVAEAGIKSQLTVVKIDEAENLPERSANHDYKGKLVVMI
ncbi:chaperonin 10-like protein [Rhexocercosporidium sp. MPI-PUGE-AT-0058]|nr:chaperonin 10-like protein [Rhexocercosporidium sp. MPI-PUGE-AT-0058]